MRIRESQHPEAEANCFNLAFEFLSQALAENIDDDMVLQLEATCYVPDIQEGGSLDFLPGSLLSWTKN